MRVYIVAALIPLTWWGAGWVKAALEPPEVDMPDWTFREMPRQLGNWHGEDTRMDPKIAVATGAKLDTIVDRIYRDDAGHVINMHTAMFDDPAGGVYHSSAELLPIARDGRNSRDSQPTCKSPTT